MSTGRILLFLVVVSLLAGVVCWAPGCDTAAPVDMPLYGQGGLFADDDAATSDDDTTPDHTPPDAPQVDAPVSPTSLTYQSIRGTTEPNAKILVTGGLSDTDTKADATGAFCVKVALKTSGQDNVGLVNHLSFTAQDAAGNTSPATLVNIEQDTRNFSRTGVASASSVSTTRPTATPDKANDGDYNSFWEDTTNWLERPEESRRDPQWLAVKMDAIDIFWGRDPAGKYEYATNFEVYIHLADQPDVMPHEIPASELAQHGYVLVQHFEQDAGKIIAENEFDLSAKPLQARWVFLLLHESNVPGTIPDPQGFAHYSFEVAELETYGFEHPDEACE